MRFFLLFMIGLMSISKAHAFAGFGASKYQYHKNGQVIYVKINHPEDVYSDFYEDMYIALIYIPIHDKLNSFTGKTNIGSFMRSGYLANFGFGDKYHGHGYLFHAYIRPPLEMPNERTSLQHSSWSRSMHSNYLPFFKESADNFLVCAVLKEDEPGGRDEVLDSSCMKASEYSNEDISEFHFENTDIKGISIEISH